MPTQRAILVSGTDTDVGKTVVTAWLASVLSPIQKLAVIKPAQTGTVDPAVDGDEAFYRRALASRADGTLIETFVSLPEPLAPSIAAERAGRPIDTLALAKRGSEVIATHDLTIFEGAGGLLVPITDAYDFADLAQALQAAIVLVIRPALGTLNHTLLTLEAAARRGLTIECLVVSGYPLEAGTVERENLRFLRRRYPAIPLVVLQQADLSGDSPLSGLNPRILGDRPNLLSGVPLPAFDLRQLS